MAIIGKIQDKGRYLLIGFVGLALLTFILSDLTKCSGPKTGNLGTINGEIVNVDKYNEKLVQFYQADSMRVAQQERRMLNEQEQDQVRDKAFQATVDETILNKEFDALGINVSDREFNDYLFGDNGFTLMPDVERAYTDSVTGQFNRKEFERFLSERDNTKDAAALKQWEDQKKQIREQRRAEKYFQLLSQGVYVTKLEAKEEYFANKEIKSVSYVVKNFRDLEDSKVSITEKEIKDFYDKHKSEAKYQVLPGRDVKFFDIQLKPSKQDTSKFNKKLNELKAEFAASTDDSAFVATKTGGQMRFPKKGIPYRMQGDPNAKSTTYPAFMDTVFKTAGVGTVVGPYNDQGRTYLAKVVGMNTQSLGARHILLPAQKTDKVGAAAQKKVADSLAAILVADKSRFEEFVTTYSTDEGSKANGGKYDDFAKDEFVPEFSDFVIANPVGKIGVVQSDYGFHIIEVLSKKDARIPLLMVIDNVLEPGDETTANLKDEAYDLLYKIENKISSKDDAVAKLAMFDTVARQAGYLSRPVRMPDEAPRAQGFSTKNAENKIIALAFNENAKVGDLCSSPIMDDQRYIIAIVSSIRKEKGEPAYEDVYERMRFEAIKEKKANMFIKQIGKTTNLNELAKKLGTSVMNAEVTFANPSLQGGGYEPEIIGSLFSGLRDRKSTLPLIGNAGVYVFRLEKTVKAPAATNYDAERDQLLARAKQSQQQEVMNALRKKEKVYDNRVLSELNIFR